MQTYYFDQYGWLSTEPVEGRETQVAPPTNELPAGCGWNFTGYEWLALPLVPVVTPPKPAIVITSVTSDKPQQSIIDGVSVATVPQGAVLTVAAELRTSAGGAVLARSDVFRMPLIASDGRERVILATMQDGLLSVVVPLRESGVWAITEEGINRAIAPDQRMQFAGLQIFVVIA